MLSLRACNVTTEESSSTPLSAPSSLPTASLAVSLAPPPHPRKTVKLNDSFGPPMTLFEPSSYKLLQANLTPPFWVEALHTPTYLLNRRPSRAIAQHTPLYLLYGIHPQYDHLRVFGCLCFPNTYATMDNKLWPRSTRCIFLGYLLEHKGYRCYDLDTRRVIVSRHIILMKQFFHTRPLLPGTKFQCPQKIPMQHNPSNRISRIPRLHLPHTGPTCRHQLQWPGRLPVPRPPRHQPPRGPL